MNNFRIPLSVLLLTFLTTAHGQTQRLSIGIEGGPSLISLRGNSAVNSYGSGFSFAAGVAVQYNISTHFSLRTNVHFERKGTNTKVLFTDVNGATIRDGRIHLNFDYITLPLLARYSVGERIRFMANAGPFVGYLLNQTGSFRGVGNDPSIEYFRLQDFNRIDFGIALGVGTAIPIGSHILFSVELRDNLGLMNISKVPVIGNGSIKTNSVVLLIGLAYSFGNTVIGKGSVD